MNKRKAIFWILGVLLALTIGVAVLLFWGYVPTSPTEFSIADTLPDGEGRRARVILLGGQSNASGSSQDEYLKKTTTPEQYAEYERGYDNVYIHFYATGSNASAGFVKASVRQGEYATHFGPELGMAERLSDLYPDETVFLIKCAWGGSNLFQQWRSPTSFGATGSLYRDFVRFVHQSLDYLVSKNYDVSIEGMCWMQGESDSVLKECAAAYEKLLTHFIADTRKEFSAYASEDGIAFVDAYVADNPAYWIHYERINASKQAVADASPLNVVIDTIAEGLTAQNEPEGTPDLAHYDAQSELRLGHLFIDALVPFMD